MTPNVKDFAELVRWLAERYHRGHIYPMAPKIGVSPAIVDRWAHGQVRAPSLISIGKLCSAYRLDSRAVIRLVTKSMLLVALVGGPVAAQGEAAGLSVGVERAGATTKGYYVNILGVLWRLLHDLWTSVGPAARAARA